MGVYLDYLNKQLSFPQLVEERRKALCQIATMRGGRDILVISADLTKNAPIQIEYTDLLPVSDLISDMHGKEIDIILETPGGFAEVVEDIVRIIRNKYEKVGIIIPGYAKSAGTIFAMAGDEILMGITSALGPIDGQIMFQGKRFSADAFLKGLKAIKDEVEETGKLNKAYIPILQSMSPGEIQHCNNVQNFAKDLVTRWLKNYKFKYWTEHDSTKKPVTDIEREERAKKISEDLSSQSKWFSHGRSLRKEDMEDIRIKITDYSLDQKLNDAITRYYTLLRMTFESTGIYKLFETQNENIMRFQEPIRGASQQTDQREILVPLTCPKCKLNFNLQFNFEEDVPLKENAIPCPTDDVLKCPKCDFQNNISNLRLQIEANVGKKAVR